MCSHRERKHSASEASAASIRGFGGSLCAFCDEFLVMARASNPEKVLHRIKYDHGIMTTTIIEKAERIFSMKRIPAGQFKTHCLAVMDEVQAKRETVLITKHGRPVAKLVPAGADADDIFGFLAGKGTVTGDIVSPALSPE